MNSVRVRLRECVIGVFGLRGNKDRDDGCCVAGFVKVFQIKAVVPSLIEVRALVTPLAYFEFDRTNDIRRDQDGIDAAADARNIELEVNPTGQAGEVRVRSTETSPSSSMVTP